MKKKKIQMLQESPAQEFRNQKIETKLKLRQEKLIKLLIRKRNIYNQIKRLLSQSMKKKNHYTRNTNAKAKDSGIVAPKTT